MTCFVQILALMLYYKPCIAKHWESETDENDAGDARGLVGKGPGVDETQARTHASHKFLDAAILIVLVLHLRARNVILKLYGFGVWK